MGWFDIFFSPTATNDNEVGGSIADEETPPPSSLASPPARISQNAPTRGSLSNAVGRLPLPSPRRRKISLLHDTSIMQRVKMSEPTSKKRRTYRHTKEQQQLLKRLVDEWERISNESQITFKAFCQERGIPVTTLRPYCFGEKRLPLSNGEAKRHYNALIHPTRLENFVNDFRHLQRPQLIQELMTTFELNSRQASNQFDKHIRPMLQHFEEESRRMDSELEHDDQHQRVRDLNRDDQQVMDSSLPTEMQMDSELDGDDHQMELNCDDLVGLNGDDQQVRDTSLPANRYISRKVAKYFESKIFQGTVTEFDHKNGWYMISYDDGDSEQLDIDELEQAMDLHSSLNICNTDSIESQMSSRRGAKSDEGKGPSKMRRQNKSIEEMITIDNEEQEKTDSAPAGDVEEERGSEEKSIGGDSNLHDSREKEAHDVALMQHNVERGSNAKEQEINWDCYDQNKYQNEYDLSGANSRSVNSGDGRQPHDDRKENNATADASTDDVDKDVEIHRLRAELKEAVSLNKQLKERAIEVDTIKARSQSDDEKQQSVMSHLEEQLHDVCHQLNEKSPLAHDLELVRAEMDTQLMRTATAQLEERLAKDAACVKLDELTKKLETTESSWKSKMEEREDDLLSELKAKSCVIEELRRENESLRHQLKLEKKKNSSQCAVKEEELTDDEYIFSRWKESESRNECSVKEEELTDDE